MANPFPATVVIDQSADFYLNVTYQDSTGANVNLTGYTAAFSIASTYGKTPLLTVTQANGITLGGTAGTIAIHLTNTQTNTLGEGSFVAELAVTSGAGVETSLLKGPITCKGKVNA